MDRKDKIREAVYRRHSKGEILSTAEIIECVTDCFPEIPVSSILPSDFCCNHTNKDKFSGKYHIFKKIRYAYYEVL